MNSLLKNIHNNYLEFVANYIQENPVSPGSTKELQDHIDQATKIFIDFINDYKPNVLKPILPRVKSQWELDCDDLNKVIENRRKCIS